MSAGRLAVGLLALLALTGLGPLAEAHNPAETLFSPTPVGESLLVVGGEGTYAYLEPDGTLLDRGNISGDGEVLGAPATTGEHAAVLVRSFPDLVPHLQGFDREGPTWNVSVGEAETFGFVQARADGFTVFTTDGQQVTVSSAGEVIAETELPASPVAEPEPASAGGWWLPASEAVIRVEEGQARERLETQGRPTDVTLAGQRLLVSQTSREGGGAPLTVAHESGSTQWSRNLSGLRLGGSPAVLEDRIVVSTYDPDGARVLALEPETGRTLWEQRPADATAAAPAAFEGEIVVATTEGITSYTAEGEHRWTRGANPYLQSPAVVGDLTMPASSSNVLLALYNNGTQAWSWTDGVEMPSWSHHGQNEENASENDSRQPQPEAAPALPGAAIGALLALAAGWAGVSGRRQR